MYLIFDTETTGLPKNYNAPFYDTENWPRMVQLAWQLHEVSGGLIEAKNFIIQPEGFDIPFNAIKIHGITTERAQKEGHPLQKVLQIFYTALSKSHFLIGHNIGFDINIVGCEFFRSGHSSTLLEKKFIDTKDEALDYCALPGGIGGKFKWPTLTELHQKLFGVSFSAAHNASADVEATARCFLELLRLGIVSPEKFGMDISAVEKFKKRHTTPIQPIGINITQEKTIDHQKRSQELKSEKAEVEKRGSQRKFAHLHNHTAFSILSATTDISSLVARALQWNMPAVGMTDSGNMMGAFYFLNAIETANARRAQSDTNENHLTPPLKGVVGCEVFLSEDYLQKKFTKDQPDRRYKQVLLAKNKKGYQNLARLCSEGYIKGYYAGYPRVGKDLVATYKEDLIALTGDLSAEIPYTILNGGERQAEEVFKWWHKLFKEDFYVELLRHGLEEEDHVNEVLLRFARKYGVKYIPQNNSFYLEKKDANAHDILLCVRDGEKQSTPIGLERGRGYRFGFSNQEFYFKSTDEMLARFSDVPKAFDYLEELIGKINTYSLNREVLLPEFKIPENFINPLEAKGGKKRGENAYLRHLACEGAKKRYGAIDETLKERLDFELKTIEKTGYPGYFLIVQDFVAQAEKMGVSAGPGRGSVAGSLVAYCTGITHIDPIKYDLLFERFLNPDRISLPDIDMDFDDRGRDRIIEWVVDKYGSNQVAQIITYGSMAAKSAIRDTARALDLPLAEADRLAKMMPNLSLKKLLSASHAQLYENLSGEDLENALKLQELSKKESPEGVVLQQASILEGSVRNTGVHACGVIITPYDITEHIPMAISKDSDLLLTQFDNNVVESAGLLKMDFLGLKTLTIIKDAIELIEKQHRIKLLADQIPLDDEKTYALFQRGDTIAVFQYESPGMQRYMRQLKPDTFDDLIAMNALYRPGPLQYIPNFIARKHGEEPIVYDLPEMEEFLSNTYGITVYQEQVMLLAQKLAGFGKGEADILRKAMGKKQKHVLDKMKNQFIEGATERGYPQKVLEKIWHDWEAFASYAFNKSHSTCYAYLAFQTAYLKAHYPAEYMAAVLSNNMNNIKEVTFFMEECRRMNVSVLGPDINESQSTFSVNEQGAIRFGMEAVKGVGEAAVETILSERTKNGPYLSIFDLVKRVDLRTANKKAMESLALSGAFDEFKNIHRAQYFHEENSLTTLEKILRFGARYQENKKCPQASLFGETIETALMKPSLSDCAPWPSIVKLSKEKEVVGVYISAHPLDDYRHEVLAIKGVSLEEFSRNEAQWIGKELHLYGIITRAENKTALKSGNRYGVFTLEDYQGMREFRIFGESYMKFSHLLVPNTFVDLKISLDRWKGGEVRINFLQIQLLCEVLEHLNKGLHLEINLQELSSEMITHIEYTISKYKGPGKLKVMVLDHIEKLCLGMHSRGYGVRLERNLLLDLEKIPGLDFHLK
ncbi:DNA polymerase III subunit alpha [Bacteroidetes bacterium endosymbiont of Geopemphigus sp.]|uniref:DNA polymerase III subunit alpha n=1 Tax=Bacteroidetes bacterium endosymbiont of Geopemphigus sp. TaxID=2047937 RepID=UPI000CD15229|nr:DNA polymerase III subunit alpha [Bacteroidetes bacterium endosymbiont of Geopemphigus sp.]